MTWELLPEETPDGIDPEWVELNMMRKVLALKAQLMGRGFNRVVAVAPVWMSSHEAELRLKGLGRFAQLKAAVEREVADPDEALRRLLWTKVPEEPSP